MNRTQRYKILYLAILVVAVAAAVSVIIYAELGTPAIVALAIVLLVPGRVGGYFLKDLFRGRHHLTKGEYEEAIATSKRFLDVVDRQPWRQNFMSCFFGLYTWSTRAMALNNIGAANMELGRLDEAETHLLQALELDDAYPLPYYNLAVVAAVRGAPERSDDMLLNARQRGFSQSLSDNVIARVAAAYARIQSWPT